MKKHLILLILISLLGCTTTQLIVEVPENVNLPKKVLFLAQSGTQSSLFQTVIDLDVNELVILEYQNSILSRVYRTGIKVNPKDYHSQVIGTDAPYATANSGNNTANKEAAK